MKRSTTIKSRATPPRLRPSALAIVAMVCGLAAFAPRAHGQTAYEWRGTTSSDPTVSTNWQGTAFTLFNQSSNSRLNIQNGAASALNYSAAQGTTTLASSARALVIGNSSGTGSMLITGGTLSLGGASTSIIGANAATGSLEINGGRFEVTSGGFEIGGIGLGNPGTGTLTLTAGVAVLPTLSLQAANGNATINLNGGTLTLGTLTVGTAANTSFRFNGGTLQASASSTTFLQNFDAADVRNGGAVIDSGAFNIGLPQVLRKSQIGGDAAIDGGLRKLGSGTLTLSAANTFNGPTVIEAGTLLLADAAALQASTFDTASSGTLSFGTLTSATFGGLTNSGTLALQNASSAALALTVGGGNASSTFAGRLTGSGSLTKIGSGTLTLTGATNDYAGTTTVSAGTLLLSNTAAIPGIVTAGRYSVAANATLATGTAFTDATLQSMIGTGNFAANAVLGVNTGAGSRTFANSLSGTVGLAISGGNGLTLSNSNALGAIALTSSTLTLSNANALGGAGTITVNGGTIDSTVGASYGFNSRAIAVTGSGATFRNNASTGSLLTLSGLSGTGAVTLAAGSSAGALFLFSGANSYSGGTILKPGASVAYTVVGNGFGTGLLTIEGGSLRSTSGGERTISNTVSLAGNVGFIAVGSGQTDQSLLFTGSMTIVGATRTVDVVHAVPASGTTGIYFNGPIGDGGNGFGLVKTGTSMLVLGGANTYSGTTTLADGTLRLANASALGGGGNLSFTGGTLQYTASNTADYASRIKGSTAAIRIDPNGQSITYAGSIDSTNSGGLRLGGSGTLTLSASNSYTGGSTVSAGTLRLGNANALGGSTGALAVNGGTLDLGGFSVNVGALTGSAGAVITTSTAAGTATLTSAVASGTSIFGGVIQDNGSGVVALTKSGAGVLALLGVNTYTGATTVAAGSLFVTGQLGNTAVTVDSGATLGGSGSIAGAVTVNGFFSPGTSPGLLSVAALTLGGTSTSVFEIDGLTRATQYDGTDVIGLLTYGGSLVIDFGSGITAAFADDTTFNLFDFASYSGLFTSITTVNDGSFYGGLTFASTGAGDTWTATKDSQTLEFTHSTATS
ncbi:MAG: beta strand repeat-containing protein [Planctomycetia bacterium]